MLEARLSEAHIFRKVVDAIKELVNEANFDCNASGMTVQAMDTTHVALATLLLRSEGFDGYRCDRNIPLGINLTSLTKILKSANNNDALTIRAEDSGDSVGLVFESANDDRVCEYDLKLMSLDTEHLGIPDTPYDSMIGMSSAEFQRIVRDLSTLSESVTINVTKDVIKFSAQGDIGSGSIAIKPRDSADNAEEDVNISVTKSTSTTLSLKFLTMITKATPLASRIIIGVTEDLPVSMEYKIGEIGYLRYYLAPKVGEDE